MGDNPNPKSLCLQDPSDHRHAKARVIDIGVAGHQNDVAGIPAQQIHLVSAHRQERRRAETMGPIGAVGEDILRGGHVCSQVMGVARVVAGFSGLREGDRNAPSLGKNAGE